MKTEGRSERSEGLKLYNIVSQVKFVHVLIDWHIS